MFLKKSILAMRRVNSSNCSVLAAALLSLPVKFHTTGILQQMQHPQLITKTHGYGLVRHDAQYNKDVTSAPAADLAMTAVDRGLGTGADDPFTRTLPNLELIPPESSTLSRGGAIGANPTIDEIAALSRRSDTLAYWFGGATPRLASYLLSLRCGSVAPSSPMTDTLLNEFHDILIPEFAASCETPVDPSLMQASWRSLVSKFNALPLETLLRSQQEFFEALDRLGRSAEQVFGVVTLDSAHVAKLHAAIELLRRKAAHARNHVLSELSEQISSASHVIGGGDALLSLILDAAKQAFANGALFSSEEDASLKFLWDSLVLGPASNSAPSPLMTAPVALYFYSVGLALGSQNFQPESDARIDSNLSSSTPRGTQKGRYDRVPVHERRAFVIDALRKSSSVMASKAFIDGLQRVGLKQESKLAEAIVSAQLVHVSAARKSAEILIPYMSDVKFTNQLFTRIAHAQDPSAHTAVLRVLKDHNVASVSQDSASWPQKGPKIVVDLIADDVVRDALLRVVQSTMQSTVQVQGGLLTPAGLEALKSVHESIVASQQRMERHKQQLANTLASFENMDRTLAVLHAVASHVIDFTSLERTNSATLQTESLRRRVTSVPSEVFQHICSAVTSRHPGWVTAGVVQQQQLPKSADSQSALVLAARMYLRTVYVPHAGAAVIARQTRRRIGPVGVNSHEQNVTVEVGQVDRYDNLLHKRYDWQGWYQRMTDIHNRNVSIRCKLHELRTLDANGRPFVDLQGERRLRIVAQDRVGMGILKLDSDRYEDQADNFTHGSMRLSQLLADARKTQLGPEYWPSVEVRVRRPSGQSKMLYSVVDYDRIEKRSEELYAKYREAKKTRFFVTPVDLWLDVKGLQARKTTDTANEDGYTVEGLFNSLDTDNGGQSDSK